MYCGIIAVKMQVANMVMCRLYSQNRHIASYSIFDISADQVHYEELTTHSVKKNYSYKSF
jgi:hypothetical protein